MRRSLSLSLSLRAGARKSVRGALRAPAPARPLSVGLVQHRPSPDNRPDAPFEWTAESKAKIADILSRYPASYRRSAVIPLLYVAQEQCGNWLPLAGMNKVAEELNVAPIRVYETATFYTMFNREPVGKYHIQLCGTTPCQLCGAEGVREAIEKNLGIKEGETTEDKMFTLSEVECLGACVNAPMIQVNNHEFYENLTPESVVRLLGELRAGTAKVGPQNGQKDCEGPKGRTTLADAQSLKPVCRDLDALKEEAEAAAAAATAKQ